MIGSDRRDPAPERRGAPRRTLALEGRVSWTDLDGRRRTATIRTRDLSATGVLVECVSGCGPIPLYRLVDIRLDQTHEDLPAPFHQPKVPAAVYRVGPRRPSTGLPESFALRLLVTPGQVAEQVASG